MARNSSPTREQTAQPNFTSRPDPAMKKWDKLIGTWELKGRTLDSKYDNIFGTTTFEWMPGRFFLKSISEIHVNGQRMETIEMIGYDPKRKVYPAWVYSSLSGDVWAYEWELKGNMVKHSGLGAHYIGRVSADGSTIAGEWRPDEGTPFTDGTAYDSVMTRVK